MLPFMMKNANAKRGFLRDDEKCRALIATDIQRERRVKIEVNLNYHNNDILGKGFANSSAMKRPIEKRPSVLNWCYHEILFFYKFRIGIT